MLAIAPSSVLAGVAATAAGEKKQTAFDLLPGVWVVFRRKQTGLCKAGVSRAGERLQRTRARFQEQRKPRL